MSKEIRIVLNDDQEQKFNDIHESEEGNRKVVMNKLIEFALDKFHKKLFKPQSVLDNLAGAKNE